MANEDIKELLRQKAEKLTKGSKPERGIHSPLHSLAKEVSEYCQETEEFAMYLGVIKNIGLTKGYRIFSEIKQSRDVRMADRGKLFLYKSKYKPEKKKRPVKSFR